ncbi:putative cyclin-D6-1 [Vitis vinifera]|uniref:Putative cyclin-D6-1 n=1 Tax=Vitis vinifera TaxID=29760 RepID=A0A438CYL5_VITVI|nr:putative cyclin-D6-1 [Vitis vinifera]
MCVPPRKRSLSFAALLCFWSLELLKFQSRKEWRRKKMELDLENPLTCVEEEQYDTVSALFDSESDHMVSQIFLRRFHAEPLRREAIALILQAQYSCNLDNFISYLAVNYVDRFISKKEVPEEKPWILRLLVISCLSLAAKMKKIDFSYSDFQKDEGFIFDAQRIHRMELLILSTLNWRMRSITPFSFVYFFISLFELKDPALTKALKDRATELIFKARDEIKLLEYKPSIIAASALLCASYELFPLQFSSFKAAISSCEYINQESLNNCYHVMEEMVTNEWDESIFDAAVSSTKTPICVLDRHYKNSVSEKSNTANTLEAAIKQPRGHENKAQRSQIQHFASHSQSLGKGRRTKYDLSAAPKRITRNE